LKSYLWHKSQNYKPSTVGSTEKCHRFIQETNETFTKATKRVGFTSHLLFLARFINPLKKLYSNPMVKRRYSLCYAQHNTNRRLCATPFTDTGCQSTEVTKHLSAVAYY
jgi:hypothetical protein